jgi:hypothetical protein
MSDIKILKQQGSPNIFGLTSSHVLINSTASLSDKSGEVELLKGVV